MCCVQLTARSQCAGCHRTSISVVAHASPSAQHIKAEWKLIGVCNWCYYDRPHCISCCLYCDLNASGIIDIKYICPVRRSHSAVIGTACPWNTHDGDSVNSHSWLHTQITTYIHVHKNEELVCINWRWWGITLKNRWTYKWRETIKVYEW